MNNHRFADENQKNLYKKFPSTHYLSNPSNVDHVLLWSTFFRRNLHRLAIDYLGIKLHIYQQIILYFMGICQLIAIIASRAAAKSFIIALYACCRAITRPYTRIVLGSATRGQSKLIISEKIVNELMEMSPALRKEIRSIKDSQNESVVYFKNGSTIKVFTANKFARGLRSHVAVREECMQIEQDVDNSVISPFQTIRQAPYMLESYYSSIEALKEDPVDVYISSSWFDGHYVWTNIVDPNFKDMLNGKNVCVLAFDESITLKHNIRTQKQMQLEKKKQDPITFAIEFLNLRPKQNASSYFTYKMLMDRQSSKYVFYPRTTLDFKSNKKNKYAIPKLDNEVRVISNDIAFVAGNQNDNSVYSCIRGIPETITYNTETDAIEVKQGYRRTYPFIESNQMGDTTLQAIRIRQLFEDFNGDFIVIDARNGGLQVVYTLEKVLFDEERGIEYPPLKVMNNDEYAKVCQDKNAKECIYVINATQTLNSDIAVAFRKNLLEGKIDFLVNYNTAREEILNENKDYMESIRTNPEKVADFELPFLETQLMINECAELQYEKLQQTGLIKIFEKGSNRKDRYTSCSYGSYFLDMLELDMFGKKQVPHTNVSSLTALARKPKLYSH